MAESEFKRLFSPLKIGPITVPNRIVCTAHWTCYFLQDEPPNERLMHYLAVRARGGVKETYAVGHCLTSRLLPDSIWDGAHVGRLL